MAVIHGYKHANFKNDPNDSIACWTGGRPERFLSVSNKTFFAFIFLKSKPTSFVTPGPYLIKEYFLNWLNDGDCKQFGPQPTENTSDGDTSLLQPVVSSEGVTQSQSNDLKVHLNYSYPYIWCRHFKCRFEFCSNRILLNSMCPSWQDL